MSDYWPWKNFTPQEIRCKCCGELYIDDDLMYRLQILRKAVSLPLHINSGHRCRLHNQRVGGAPYSQHKALAVDISLQNILDSVELYHKALQVGFLGIGLAGSFIHLDMRRKIDGYQPPRKRTVWFYSEEGKKKWMNLLAFSEAQS